MSAKRTGLGRNLSALLQQTDEASSEPHENSGKKEALLNLPVSSLKPGQYQPRGTMDDAALKALAASIAAQGVLQPIVVRQCQNKSEEAHGAPPYEIIAGERRWRASQLAKCETVPVIVRDVSDETAMALGLIENLQREALNVMDEARAMNRLRDEFGLTHHDIAVLLSKSRAAVSNCLRLLQLSAPVAILLEAGKLDMGHARCLLTLAEDEQVRAADLIVRDALSVRAAEALVVRMKTKSPVKAQKNIMRHVFDDELKQIGAFLGANVQLKSAETGRGRLLIDFKNTQQLKSLLQRLMQQTTEVLD